MKPIRKIIVITISITMLGITAAPAFAASGLSKEETVYVVTESDGSQSEVTVSDHLINGSESKKLADRTNLQKIENVKGEETFEKGEGDNIVWDAEGSDIFYDGVTDEAVPVQLKISYFLNGEEVQGSELEGASGDVKIVIDYRNSAKSDNGTTIPFIAITAFIAEDDTLTDINVDHGKVIDNGEKQIVAAIAAPGLSEALNIDSSLLDLGLEDTVTITGTAKDFEVQDIMTVVTNSVFEEIDSDGLGDLDYDGQINELDKGAKQLMDGSRQLYEGIDTLYANMPNLRDGIDKLADGSDKVSAGADSTLSGARRVNSGAKELKETLTTKMKDAVDSTARLQFGSEMVLGGMKEIKAGLDGDGGAIEALTDVKTGLDSAYSGIGTVNTNMNTAKVKNSDVQQYLNKLQTEFNKISDSDKEKLRAKGFDVSLIDEVGGKISEQQAVGTALNSATGQEGLPRIRTGVGLASNGVDAVIGDSTSGLTHAAGVLGEYDASRQQQTTLIGIQTEVNAGLVKLHDTLGEATGKNGDLTRGLSALLFGTEALESGEVQLAGGARQLARGMQQLQEKSSALSTGVSELDRGSLKLSRGMSEMYNEGIRKIVDLYNNELKGNIDSLQDMLDASQSYDTFTRLPDSMDGSVKFIYKTTVY